MLMVNIRSVGFGGAYIIDEGALSFVTVIYFPIWILHITEIGEGQ